MNASLLIRRGLRHHRRMHVAVALGVAVACATVTGALIVGDSMRGSLRAQAGSRLGQVDAALLAPRFFRAALAESAASAAPAPAIIMRGGARHTDSQRRSGRVTILGVDERAWPLLGAEAPAEFAGRVVALNETLAGDLQAQVGDDVLLSLANPSTISIETLLGRRDEAALALRVTVVAVLPDAQGGGFSLQPSQAAVRSAFVPLSTLQRALHQVDRVNVVLFPESAGLPGTAQYQALVDAVSLDDLGLRLRGDVERGYVSLESDAMLLAPSVEKAAGAVATELAVDTSPLMTYLATRISKASAGAAAVPYSVVAALDPASSAFRGLRAAVGDSVVALSSGELLLNAWTAEQLSARPGERVTLEYLVTGPFGQLVTKTAEFTLRGVVGMDAASADPGYAPEYPGITDARSLADWDPPFPLELARIRPADETYWDQYRTAPKVFVTLEDGQRLWADQPERFGSLTSVRFHVPKGRDALEFSAQVAAALRRQLDPAGFGFAWLNARADALASARGATDFGMLFIGFSMFLIASAAMLAALLFRLGAEQRSSEMGLLLATGYRPGAVARLLLGEAALVSLMGVLVGLALAAGYAWVMLAGLRSWWSAAANAPFLQLYVSPVTLAVGGVATWLITMGSLAWSVRGLARQAPRALLAGQRPMHDAPGRRPPRRVLYLALGASALSLGLLVYALVTSEGARAPLFFGVGAGMLTAVLAFAYLRMMSRAPVVIAHSGRGAWSRLGMRNAPRHPGRSLLTLALMASAVFLVVSVGAFHIEPPADASDPHSGLGGYALLAESAVPLPYDLDSPAGRENLGFTPEDEAAFGYVNVDAFRLRAGDEASCLSLYQAREPRLLGASDLFIERGRFRFAASLAETEEERANPWRLLSRQFADGAVPVIGDEAAVKWQLKSGLGKDLVIRDERGADVRLRFVALLSGSILQSEVILAEGALTGLFPSLGGHSFFLISAPPAKRADLEKTIEANLERYSIDVTSTAQRLDAYVAVQNTYLGTFQTLGGLGLILGSAGLGVVMLRNVAERRGELALLRALGFTRRALGWMVFAENALLVTGGLVCGAVPALIAITPQLVARPQAVPVVSLGLTLLGVLVVGLASGLLALRATLRAPLLRALRNE